MPRSHVLVLIAIAGIAIATTEHPPRHRLGESGTTVPTNKPIQLPLVVRECFPEKANTLFTLPYNSTDEEKVVADERTMMVVQEPYFVRLFNGPRINTRNDMDVVWFLDCAKESRLEEASVLGYVLPQNDHHPRANLVRVPLRDQHFAVLAEDFHGVLSVTIYPLDKYKPLVQQQSSLIAKPTIDWPRPLKPIATMRTAIPNHWGYIETLNTIVDESNERCSLRIQAHCRSNSLTHHDRHCSCQYSLDEQKWSELEISDRSPVGQTRVAELNQDRR